MAERTFDSVFRTRGVTSIFYVLAWMAALFLSPWLFIGVMALAYLVCFREFEFMLTHPEEQVSQLRGFWTHALTGLLAVESLIRFDRVCPVLMLAAVLFLLIGMGILFLHDRSPKVFALRKYKTVYPGIGILAAVWIAFPDGWGTFQPMPLLALLILIWANDSYAYIFGKTWGRHPLWAAISPKKTWEGTLGGAAGTFLTAWLWTLIFESPGLESMMVSAVIVSVFGPMGDLFESKVKRNAGIKDSGNWLPGHGGLLDRLDSFLWVAPAYWLITIIFFS